MNALVSENCKIYKNENGFYILEIKKNDVWVKHTDEYKTKWDALRAYPIIRDRK